MRQIAFLFLLSVVHTEMLSNNSSVLWKDMEEGISRCLMRLGRHQQALDSASQLVSIKG